MSLLDAIGSVLGGIWAFVSAPALIAITGMLLAIFAFFAVAGSLLAPEKWVARLLGTMVSLAVLLLGISLAVWGMSSESPFVWRT